MVRLGLLALPLLVACTGDIQSDNLVGLPITEQVAQQAWAERAYPILGAKCLMCHDGSMPMIGYLAGEDDLMKRETLVNYVPRVINLGAPRSSRIVTKGMHTGPALDITESDEILLWLKQEVKVRPAVAGVLSAMVTPVVCTDPANVGGPNCMINIIDLTPAGAAGSIEFVVQQVGPDSYYTNLKVKAGAEGIYLEHPLLQSYVGGASPPKPDPIDRYFQTTVNLMPNTEMPLGSGTTSLAGFSSADPIDFQFDVVEKYRPGT